MAGFIDAIDTKEAQILFDAGALSEAIAVAAPMANGHWLLQLKAKNRSEPYTLAAQREPQRVFKSSDAVIATANKIGFRAIKFEF
jgi:hypothetical protein